MTSLDLGMVGNCTIGALIDRRGTVVWSCFPRFDGDPVFCRLLDEEGMRGFYSIELDDMVETEQAYLPNTAVLVTRLIDRSGNHIRYVGPDSSLRLTTNAPLTYVNEETPFILEDQVVLMLGPDESLRE